VEAGKVPDSEVAGSRLDHPPSTQLRPLLMAGRGRTRGVSVCVRVGVGVWAFAGAKGYARDLVDAFSCSLISCLDRSSDLLFGVQVWPVGGCCAVLRGACSGR
jgi:hypothetical protein